MGRFDDLDRFLEEGNGFLQTASVLNNGISKGTLEKYVKDRNLERVAHGVYMSEDAWPDDYYLLFLRNKRLVFSHESALYLHGFMEREPSVAMVTVPKGYNSTHIGKQGVKVYHAKPEWYVIGISTVRTGFGNEVQVYDRERTICDVIRCKREMEIQVFQTALREYMSGKEKNLGILIDYAKRLGIEREVRTYTEVML